MLAASTPTEMTLIERKVRKPDRQTGAMSIGGDRIVDLGEIVNVEP